MEETIKDAFSQLQGKMRKEIDQGHPYEALQLAESYVARKKKTFGRSVTSALVFHGCQILIDSKASADAGTLLMWFIEDGAGDDYYFRFEENDLSGDVYCDVQRLIDLLSKLSPTDAFPMVDKIYGPLHKAAVKKNVSKSSSTLTERLNRLELNLIDIFEATNNWYSAYKAIVRLGDMNRAARLLNSWARDGYASEQPLFFGRACLQLLSEGHIQKAQDLITASEPYIVENVGTNAPEGANIQDAALAVWHLSKILTGLAVLEPRPRVDKPKIFGIITTKYSHTLLRLDPKLTLLFEKIGQHAFGIRPAGADQPNPMAAMFQSMFANPPPAPAAAPAISNSSSSSSKSGSRSKSKSKAKTAPGGNPTGTKTSGPDVDLDAMMNMLSTMK